MSVILKYLNVTRAAKYSPIEINYSQFEDRYSDEF